jgi:flagellar hook-basal body complex protein FliE
MIASIGAAARALPEVASPETLHGGGGFAEAFDQAVRAVDAKQVQADEGLRGIASGNNVDLHGSMIALEEANISLRAMTSVRDKVVEAYQSIWNMPI